MRSKDLFLALFVSSAFFACVDDIGGVLRTTDANRLLSFDSLKTWVMVSQSIDGVDSDLSDCANHQALVFANYASEADTLFQVSRAFECEGQLPILSQKLVYEVDGNLEGHFSYSLSVYPNENAERQTIEVLDITSQYLRIGFIEEEKEVIEVYNFDAAVHADLVE